MKFRWVDVELSDQEVWFITFGAVAVLVSFVLGFYLGLSV